MLLRLENITKSYGDPSDDTHRVVLEDLSLQMEAGESIAILGPSGSGKTTLLNIIGSLDHPDSGKVLFDDRNIVDLSDAELDHFRNRQIGFVFQFHHLLPQCTLLENVLIPTLVIRDSAEKRRKAEEAEQLLLRTGIWDHRNRLPGKLSGGECQRAAVVRAMINNPSLLLADEPTGALDRENVEKQADLLTDLNRSEGLALLVVTHSRDLAARMGKTYILRKGKLEQTNLS
jgi:ABC-type lipoprotein export system ATPase subunit